jgi:crossover junction endodeoxyribonuclease RusA
LKASVTVGPVLERRGTVELPFPPSINSYWLRGRHGTYLSPAGRRFRALASRQAASDWIWLPLAEPTIVEIDLYPPDQRGRDLDNHDGKAILDALVYGGVLRDDVHVKGRLSRLHEPEGKPGRAVVSVYTFRKPQTKGKV